MAQFSNELSRSLASQIVDALEANKARLKAMWDRDQPFRYLWLDDLLPEGFVGQIKANLPPADSLLLKSSLRERKRVGVDFRGQHECLQASIFAFQEPEVIAAVSKITGMLAIEGDPSLYASGISVMGKGDFLNPHLDNSHDGDQKLYRNLNLLFYVSPGWKKENGGSFEMWDRGVDHQVEVEAKFNRLVIMETHNYSWHSVNKVVADDTRVCVSNYYFSAIPTRGVGYRHVTTFTGRPEQKVRRMALRADGLARNVGARIFPRGMAKAHRLEADAAEK